MLDLENNSIILVSNKEKKSIITNLNKKFLNIKVMTIEEFIKKYTFDYDEKTIYKLMTKYNIKYEIAKNYIKNIYYIDEMDYNNEKINKLVEIKKYLEENNLLIYDKLFKKFIKNKTIYIYYDKLSKYQEKILKDLNIKKIERNYNEYKPTIHEFGNITEEVEFVAYNICKLIESGVDINNIKLVNVSTDYYNEIRKIFKFYNIPINLNKKNIYGTKIVKDFIEKYSNNIEETLKYIEDNYNLKNEINNKIYNKIVSIINEYVWCNNYLDIKELIINRLKNTNLEKKYTNSIEIKELDNITDEYVFIMNFNQGSIPKIYKDEDYIDDLFKEKINIETSIENNINEKEKTIRLIKNIKNCTITYKLKTPFSSFYPSSIIEDLSDNVIKEHKIPNTSYSTLNDEINLTKKIDNLIKFGIKDNILETLYSNYEIPYNTYDNKYTIINKEKLNNYLNNHLTLSYSSMDNYYHCAFKYYINNILRLNPYEETFATIIGNLFHTVLEKSLKNNKDYKEYWDDEIKKLELSNKERFFINNLESTCKYTLETIRKQNQYSSLTNTKYEEKIEINSGNMTFKGFIDKLMYENIDDETIISVIDYKTGNASIDLNKTYYGLNLQLPIYLYLAYHSDLENIKIAGFYLQNIINKEFDEAKLKLNGYSTNNKNILKYFDSSYEDSNVIKSMKTKSDGNFYNYAKVLNDVEIANLISLVKNKINEAYKNITNANFDINPKQIGFENVGCEFCKFKDICFKSEKDIVRLKEMDYKEFLEDAS